MPAPTVIDNTTRLKHIVKVTLMHIEETTQVNSKLGPRELKDRVVGSHGVEMKILGA